MLSYLFNLTKASWHQKLYIYGIYASYLLFIIALTGVVSLSPTYVTTLDTVLKYYVCIFLIVRFNPLVKDEKITKAELEFDRRVAFSAGMFLLLTTAITSLAQGYLTQLTGKTL
jgi:hypothetical protein